AILAYGLMHQGGGITGTVTMLGVLALGAQRLLPVLQQGYLSIIQLRSYRHSMRDALTLLNQPIDVLIHDTRIDALPFERSIRLVDLGFRYSQDSPVVLHKLNLTIYRGSRVGFIGTTGSGKSTLLDIIMGLL